MKVWITSHKKYVGCAVPAVPATKKEFLVQYAKELDYVSRMPGDIPEVYLWRMKKFPLRCPACGRTLSPYFSCLKSADVLELGCITCEYGYPVHFFKPGFSWSDVLNDNTVGTKGGADNEK